MHAGVGLVFSEWAGSLRRIELILDAAAQIAEGGNVGRTIQGKTPKERITSLAELIQATPIATDPRVADQQVQDLRRKALKYPSIVLR
jgi:hypothetical protein